MTNERRNEIEKLVKEAGLSFVDAERMIAEIENNVDANETMAGLWY